MQDAAGLHIVCEVGIGRVNRPRDDAVLSPLALLPQIDQQNAGLAEHRHGLRRRNRPTALRDIILSEAHVQIGRYCHIHHLRVGQVQVGHQLDILVDG